MAGRSNGPSAAMVGTHTTTTPAPHVAAPIWHLAPTTASLVLWGVQVQCRVTFLMQTNGLAPPTARQPCWVLLAMTWQSGGSRPPPISTFHNQRDHLLVVLDAAEGDSMLVMGV